MLEKELKYEIVSNGFVTLVKITNTITKESFYIHYH